MVLSNQTLAVWGPTTSDYTGVTLPRLSMFQHRQPAELDTSWIRTDRGAVSGSLNVAKIAKQTPLLRRGTSARNPYPGPARLIFCAWQRLFFPF